MENFFFFIHVPKAAGLTFRTILRRNFRTRFDPVKNHFFEDELSAAVLESALKTGTHLRATASHRLTADLPYDTDDYNVIGLSFIRNPVDRFISNYYYVKKLPMNTAIARSASLEEYVSKMESTPEETFFQNHQQKVIKLPPEELTKRLAEGKLHMFPIDRFDESLVLLKKLYPNDFSDISYSRTNVNKSRPEKDEEAIKERIAKLEFKDQILYELAQKHMESAVDTHFAEGELEAGLKRHNRKCKTRSLFLDPFVNFSEKVHTGLRSIKL